MSFFNDTDTESLPKKRARAGTATPKRQVPSDIPPPLPKDLDDSMSVDFATTRESISSLIGTTQRIRPHVPWGLDFIETVADNVARFMDDGFPMENAVVARFLLAMEEDEQAAHTMATKGFGNGPLAREHPFLDGIIPLRLWVRLGVEDKRKRAPTLAKGPWENLWKPIAGRSVVICSTMIAVWPPPLWLAPGAEASTMWEIEVAETSDEAKVIGGIIDALGQIYVGNITRKVR